MQKCSKRNPRKLQRGYVCNWMDTYFIKAHDGSISSRLKNHYWEQLYNINITEGNVTGLKIRWSRIPSTAEQVSTKT